MVDLVVPASISNKPMVTITGRHLQLPNYSFESFIINGNTNCY